MPQRQLEPESSRSLGTKSSCVYVRLDRISLVGCRGSGVSNIRLCDQKGERDNFGCNFCYFERGIQAGLGKMPAAAG